MEQYEVVLRFRKPNGDAAGEISIEAMSQHLPKVGETLHGLPRMGERDHQVELGLQNQSSEDILGEGCTLRVVDVEHHLLVDEGRTNFFRARFTTVVVECSDPGLSVRRKIKKLGDLRWSTYNLVPEDSDEGDSGG